MYWQKMSERTSETIRQLRKKQMRKCQMRHFTYVYLFVFVFYACILILVLYDLFLFFFSILGKQYEKKMNTYKKSQQKISTSLRALRGGTSQLELDNWHYLCSFFFLQDLILQKIESQAIRLNSIGKLVSTAKYAAKITPHKRIPHKFNSRLLWHTLWVNSTQCDNFDQFHFTVKVKDQKIKISYFIFSN